MKNILVLVNLAAGAERLAKQALIVAQQSNANLLLCNAAEISVNQEMALPGHTSTPWLFDEKPLLSLEQLADKITYHDNHTQNGHLPQICCLTQTNFNSDKLQQLVFDNQVKMIVTGISDIPDLNISGLMAIIDKANCPVLVIPDDADITTLDSTAYITDLRYCDLEVVKFLKRLNSKIYVTHVSVSGIPDMEDSYAQNMLSNSITAKLKYNKLFLRNIKGNNRKTDLELVTATTGVKFYTIVNKKHDMLWLLHNKVNSNKKHQR